MATTRKNCGHELETRCQRCHRYFQIAGEQTRVAGFTPTDNFSEGLIATIGFFKKRQNKKMRLPGRFAGM
jgi:hypothetical protein